MLYVKIMSSEDFADTDSRKCYSIVPIENNQTMDFDLNNGAQMPDVECKFVLRVNSPDGSHEVHALTGNAYVMNERGVTIASHSAD